MVGFDEPEGLQRETDERLMGMVKATHDAAAFAVLEHRYDRPLHAYLFQRMHNAHAADDAYQDTWVNVFRRADLFEDGKTFRPWLYCIGSNAAVDWQRRNRRHQHVLSLDAEKGRLDGDQVSLMDLVVDDLAAPPDILSMEEERRRVRACIDALPENERRLLLMARYEGRKYRDIADELGIPMGTVKSRLHATIIRLERLLGVEIGLGGSDQ